MALERAPARRSRPEVLALTFVQAMDRTDDAAVVQNSFQRAIEELEFTSVMCATLPVTRQLDQESILMCTWPADWADAYHARGYARHDPVLREIQRTRRTLDWPEALRGRTVTRREREVLRHAADFGITCGLVVPIHLAGGAVGFVHLAASRPCKDRKRRSAVQVVAVYAYHKLRALASVEATGRRLSQRELEILHWIAEGKSDWQIGRILAISAKTVNFHTENVKRKFGVATRMQAVVSAIQRGELILGHC